MERASACAPPRTPVVHRISGVEICTLPEEIARRMMQVSISSARLMAPVSAGSAESRRAGPDRNGVLSLELGPYGPKWGCGTCLKQGQTCMGHMGGIQLPVPIVLAQFWQYVLKTLRSICYMCYRPASRVCAQCRATQPKTIRKSANGMAVEAIWERPRRNQEPPPGGLKQLWTPLEVQNILQGIEDDTWAEIGPTTTGEPQTLNSHPRDFVTSLLLVAPPTTRVSSISDNGSSHSDVTSLFHSISISNQECWGVVEEWFESAGRQLQETLVAEAAPDDALYVDQYRAHEALPAREVFPFLFPEVHQALYSHPPFAAKFERLVGFHSALVTTSSTVKNRGQTRAWNSYAKQFGGKKGTVRDHCAGGRTQRSGRAVVAQEQSLGTSGGLIPDSFSGITRQVACGDYNRRIWKHLLARARFVKYPGKAQAVDVEYLRDNGKVPPPLEVGCMAEMPLEKGDHVLFHRLPTLDPGSLWYIPLAQTPRKRPIRTHYAEGDIHTAKIGCAFCKATNADFDGDEFNVHVMGNVKTDVEARELATAQTKLLSPSDGSPYLSHLQDSIVGLVALVNGPFVFDYATAVGLLDGACSASSMYRSLDSGKSIYSGADLYSRLFPAFFSCNLIVEGEFVPDVSLSKSALSYLFHAMIKECGGERATAFLECSFALGCNVLQYLGISFNYSDPTLSKEDLTYLDMRQAEVCGLIQRTHEHFESNRYSSGLYLALENDTRQLLNNLTMEAACLVERTMKRRVLPAHVRDPFLAVTSGAKGSIINLTNVYAQAGLFSIDKHLMGFDPNFRPHNWGPRGRHPITMGYCTRSLQIGLDHTQETSFLAHGRDSLVKQSCGTGRAGYFVRRINFMAALFHSHWEGVWEGLDELPAQRITEVYGGDGINPELLELHYIRCREAVAADFPSEGWKAHVRRAYERNRFPCGPACLERQCEGCKVPCPLQMSRLLRSPSRFHAPSDSPPEHCRSLREFVQALVAFERRVKSAVKPAYRGRWICLAVWSSVTPATIRKWTPQAVLRLLDETFRRFHDSFLPPESAVGLMASGAIGQPLSQRLLDATHDVGSASLDKVNVFDSFAAILQCKKKQPGSYVMFRLRPQWNNEADATALAASCVTVRGSDIIHYASDFASHLHPQVPAVRQLERIWGRPVIGEQRWCVMLYFRSDSPYSVCDIAAKFSSADGVLALFPHGTTLSLFFSVEEEAGQFLTRFPQWRVAGLPSVGAAAAVRRGENWCLQLTAPLTVVPYCAAYVEMDTLECTNVNDLARFFGVECANFVGLRHAGDVFVQNGINIHVRHLSTLLDIASRSGRFFPFNRSGLVNSDQFLLRCSFEQILNTLLRSAVCGKRDNLSNVISLLLTGGQSPALSGLFCEPATIFPAIAAQNAYSRLPPSFVEVRALESPTVSAQELALLCPPEALDSPRFVPITPPPPCEEEPPEYSESHNWTTNSNF